MCKSNSRLAFIFYIGVVGKDLQTLLTAVCIVLQLGNIVFGVNPLKEEESIVTSTQELQILSDIIGISSHHLAHCFTYKTMTAVHDTYQVPLRVEDAKSTCDAFAKDCYRAIFDWLVNRTNDSTCADYNYVEAERVKRYSCISVLDISGFECFETNSFEQLLINHANERLQKTFTETIIDSVIEEYNREGVSFDKIEHEDNDSVIRVLEGKMGLMPLLNEESIRPQGSDAGFVNKIYSSHSTTSKSSKLIFHRHYQLSKTLFGIRHFARDVTYDAAGFVMKNKDTLPVDVVQCALRSTNEIISGGITPNQTLSPQKTQSALTGTSLWTSFERQMTNLFKQIKQTRIWYVRCIIPNNEKKPFALDLKCALTQLRSVGLLTALKMSHASFPNKQSLTYIVRRFWMLGRFGKKYELGTDYGNQTEVRRDCEKLLNHAFNGESLSSLCVIGITKVYFRTGCLEELESKRARAYDKSASMIQARVRGILARKLYKILKLQSNLEKEVMKERKITIYHYFIPLTILPLYLLRYMFGSVRRPRKRVYRSSWH